MQIIVHCKGKIGFAAAKINNTDGTVEGATASVKGEKLILKDVKKGAYTLTITDKSGKYAPISFGFEVYAETMPAAYNENSEKPGLTKAAGATDAEFADYLRIC